jgi:hypothetical protein
LGGEDLDGGGERRGRRRRSGRRGEGPGEREGAGAEEVKVLPLLLPLLLLLSPLRRKPRVLHRDDGVAPHRRSVVSIEGEEVKGGKGGCEGRERKNQKEAWGRKTKV